MKQMLFGYGIIIIIVYALVCGWSVDYVLQWLDKDVNFVLDCVIGLFIGEFTIPIAVIDSILF